MTGSPRPAPALWRAPAEVPADLAGAVVSIGVFDGVHRGHRALLALARDRADARRLPLVVVTFDPHPLEVVRPGTHPTLLTTPSHRVQLLGEAGADAVFLQEFTLPLSRETPAEFVDGLLAGVLRAREVVVGENFRFGHRAAGDVETLAELGGAAGFDVEAVRLAGDGDEAWSSTYIRGLVAAGDVADAALALGRPHRVEGEVVHGDHRGRALGYPTANLALTGHAAVPADGVYAGRLVRDPYGPAAQPLPAAVSIGTNPQFDGQERRVEAYVLDRDDLDLYGEHVAVDLVERIRGQLRFPRVVDLVARMAVDVGEARRLLGP
ncbi:MAG: bifunctional riboflavin kinase/FAD synthetase [Candidatus Nanopelagicales bacterium]